MMQKLLCQSVQNVKYLCINITKYIQDDNEVNYKTDKLNQINKWRYILCSWIGRCNVSSS